MFLGTGVRVGLLGGAVSFSPTALFAASEPGVWYDPSDLTTLFQDTAGTIPVTAAGQSVALVLDKSKGLTLGSELVTNGDFSNGSTGWTVSAQSSISGGQARIVSTDGSFQSIAQSKTLSGPAWYQVSLDVVSVVSGSINFSFTGAGANITVPSGTGRKTVMFFVASSTSSTLSFGRTAGVTDVTIDNISVKELAGNHATQATAASRPILGRNPLTGTRNLLTYTEQFDNAAWQKSNATVTANSAVSPDGTTTADRVQFSLGSTSSVIDQVLTLAVANQTFTVSVYVKSNTGSTQTFRLKCTQSGVADYFSSVQNATTEWQRFTFTQSFGAGGTGIRAGLAGGSSPSDILIWGAQLEAGSTATAYQKVVSQYDVTQSGVADAYYLAFDGVDDFLVTPTITPGIDKAQVFAGVRKLSDAAGVIYGHGPDTNGGAGRLEVLSSGWNAAASRYGAAINITNLSRADSPANFASPRTDVLAWRFDAAGTLTSDEIKLRVNSQEQALSFTDPAQGAGNFAANIDYIGRRGGTTIPFNGRIYSLISRFGANLTAQQISDTETWVNGKTGAY